MIGDNNGIRRTRFQQNGALQQQNELQGSKGIQSSGEANFEFPSSALQAFLGPNSRLNAKRITTEDFIAKVKAAKEQIINAEGFDIAFQNAILQDPVLATAFGGYLELINAGQVAATDKKKQEAHFAASRKQVVDFLDTFQAKLEEFKLLRDSTPESLTETGLKLIQRNTDIQEARETPLENAQTYRALVDLGSLTDEQKRPFLVRLAKAAVQSVSNEANRTPEQLTGALAQLNHALTRLTRTAPLDETGREYFGEALRLAQVLDGPSGRSNQVRVQAIRLQSPDDKERKTAIARLSAIQTELLEAREKAQKQGANLNVAQLETARALVTASGASNALFEKVPDLIERLAGTPLDEAGPAGGYKPSAAETQAKGEITEIYVESIAKVFPSLDTPAAKAAHLEACEHAQSLLLEQIAQDQSSNIATLVGQLTRHPEKVEQAIELLAPEYIANAQSRLNASAATVVALLGNGQLDAAYQLFHGPNFAQADEFSPARELTMLSKATAVGIAQKMELKCAEPTLEWIANAHQRAIEVALLQEPYQVVGLPAVLKGLIGNDFRIDAQTTVDLVGRVEAAFDANGATPISYVLPVLIELCAQHPESLGAMNKAQDLVQRQIGLFTGGYVGQRQDKYGEAPVPHNTTQAAVDTLEVLSRSEQLSGMIKPMAEVIIQKHPAQGTPLLSERIPKLGKYADKDELARSLPLNNQEASVALALAGEATTTQFARELIAKKTHAALGVEVKDLTEAQIADMLRLEAAARLAVPNLITAKALVGLVKAFQQQQVPREALELARTYYPQEIIKEVLAQIDSADMRDYLVGKKRVRADKSGEPDAKEAVPVAVVGGGTVPTAE
ncbi:MAG: hypothetical protein IPG45_28375 [Deltaproteobacteria bacterium]|nr:hypothetical protein [Deltaproteobacteria bacterium]